MQIQETRDLLAHAPVLMCAQGSIEHAAARGTILFYHGFTANKEVNRKELHALAAAGYLAIGVDNWGHGERRLADFEARFADPAHWETTFVELLQHSVVEVPDLIDSLAARGLLHEGRLGLAGISMGGMIAYGAVPLDRRIRAIATIVATPKWLPTQNWPDLYPCAILSQTAGRDKVVDADEAARFHLALARWYAERPDRNAWVNYPDSEHMMRPEDFETAWMRLTDWFNRHL